MLTFSDMLLKAGIEPNIIVDVPAGHFSFVKHQYEKGLPRRATRVGLTSYKSIKNIFK